MRCRFRRVRSALRHFNAWLLSVVLHLPVQTEWTNGQQVQTDSSGAAKSTVDRNGRWSLSLFVFRYKYGATHFSFHDVEMLIGRSVHGVFFVEANDVTYLLRVLIHNHVSCLYPGYLTAADWAFIVGALRVVWVLRKPWKDDKQFCWVAVCLVVDLLDYMDKQFVIYRPIRPRPLLATCRLIDSLLAGPGAFFLFTSKYYYTYFIDWSCGLCYGNRHQLCIASIVTSILSTKYFSDRI